MASTVQAPETIGHKRLNVFERFLTVWVGLCMIAGLALGKWIPSTVQALRSMEFGEGSQVNVPIAVLIWLMIIPMMMKVDFGAIRDAGKRPRGLAVTLFVNWLVKPFSMALISWVFFRHVFSAWVTPAEADQYIAGTIILAAAPCTAMVFVWSYLTDGDPAYTLVQVSVNDLIMLFLFAPIVRFLVSGASSLSVPFRVLLYSVIAFIVIPLSVGVAVRAWLTRRHGKDWFERVFLPRFSPVTILALLATLVCIFAFQSDNITGRYLHVFLIAIPILIQVYFNSTLAYGLMRLLKVQHSVAAPGALIGASNFFELAVATAIALFGPGSGAALATVVGVLVEVPVMLSVCLQPHAALVPGGTATRGGCPVKKRVLILCTANSARSQMAEGLFRYRAGDRFEVFSAGTRPAGLNPIGVAAMAELGIDISDHRSKSVEEFVRQQFDYVITVCDSAKEACPIFPGPGKRLHHSFEDPAAATVDQQLPAFRTVRDRIRVWLEGFISNES